MLTEEEGRKSASVMSSNLLFVSFGWSYIICSFRDVNSVCMWSSDEE